ncbi:hypothetical protein NW739_01220 [Mycoplasmopsis felis]|uniref:hypothetical protein n=1 Tax=Mycoplasmopsis felis TaxID=33923 RepID=UPI0021DFCF8D|nr:hypothetical protein [Mycoplasmopsis felis]MCU9939433.1 hypothetical protein [Mycoplasmopsis felis]
MNIKAILTNQNVIAIVIVPKTGMNKIFFTPLRVFGNFPKIYLENTITIAAAKNAPKIPPINPDPIPKNFSGLEMPELSIVLDKNPYVSDNWPLAIPPTTKPGNKPCLPINEKAM